MRVDTLDRMLNETHAADCCRADFLCNVCIGGWNYLTIMAPVESALAVDTRNEGVAIEVHYKNYINPSILSFDLREITGAKSSADVFRVYLKSAKALRSHEFQEVELLHQGDVRFILAGAYFQQLGGEYDFQNPVYTMRTFSSHLYRPDGTKAFPEWTGGWLGVMTKEMEQFNEFHQQWYLTGLPATKAKDVDVP